MDTVEIILQFIRAIITAGFQAIWPLIKGFAIGIWDNPILLVFLIIPIGSWLVTQLRKQRQRQSRKTRRRK